LGVVAACTPADHECVLYDDRMEEIPFDEPTDLVAISVEIYNARRSYEIAAEYRLRGIPVVMGGFHPTLVPDECAAHADAIVSGDAEGIWPRVIEDVRSNQLQPRYEGATGAPQPNGLLPRRDLYQDKRYLPISLVQYGRGCRFGCEFCAISKFFHRCYHCRPADEVIEEIRTQGRSLIFFIDDNFVSDHEAAKILLRKLIPLKIRWVGQASIDMTDDAELMELIERSGCQGFVIGFESINPDNLYATGKASNLEKNIDDWDCYRRQIEILRKHHLQTWAAFTLGHDNDTFDSILDTLEFAERNRFCFAAFNILMPYPGTRFYTRLEAEGRLLYGGKWWLHPDYRFNHASFIPRNLTPAELTEATWRCRKRWNSPASIFKRVWDTRTHLSSLYRLGSYFAYNRLYAYESFRKQGMYLGKEAG
jgi:radical SAM superfamily enzyme YgiQ (UPF0313 family)